MATTTIPINKFRRKKAGAGTERALNPPDNIKQGLNNSWDYITNNSIINVPPFSVPKPNKQSIKEITSAPEPATFIEQDEDKDANFWKRIYSNPTLALNTLNGLTGLTLAGISKADTRRNLNKMRFNTGVASIPKQSPQKVSVLPQLHDVKNSVSAGLRTLKNNTASSKNLVAASNTLRQQGTDSLNKILTAANNSNAELAEKSTSRNTELDKWLAKTNVDLSKQKDLTYNSMLDYKISNNNTFRTTLGRIFENLITNGQKAQRDRLSEVMLTLLSKQDGTFLPTARKIARS